jgi:nucleoside-diphosphate-sugar epimerase
MEGRLTNQVLIIGAQGVLGALMVKAFRAAGWSVRCAARRPRRRQIGLDIDRPDSIEAALRVDELVINTVRHRNSCQSDTSSSAAAP